MSTEPKPVVARQYAGDTAPANVIKGSFTPVPPDEVSGHGAEVATVSECPKCHALNHIDIDMTSKRAFECWRCSSVFHV